MKSISKVALAAALVSGAGGLVVSVPAVAKDKKEAAPASPFKFSGEEAVKALSAAQTAVNALTEQRTAAMQAPEADRPAKLAALAPGLAAAEPLVAQAEAAAKNDDDKYVATVMRLQLEIMKIDVAKTTTPNPDRSRLIAPYQVLLTNPKTPQNNAADYALDLGILYFNSKQYSQAVTYFEQAQKLGSTDPNLAANLVKAKLQAGDAAGGLAELDRMIQQQTQQKGKADEELYRFALSKTIQAKDGPGTLSRMRLFLTAYPTAKNWRDMIKIYGLQQGSFITPGRTQVLDLYRLMRATGALADQYDYEVYAHQANMVGLPWEAKTVITEGRAKGIVPATGNSAAELAAANKAIAAEGSLAPLEAKSKSAADGKLAGQTADAELGSGNYAKAVELYRVALQKGGVNAAEINTRLGIALAMSGDKAGARTAFGAVTGSPSADIAALWTTYLDLSGA